MKVKCIENKYCNTNYTVGEVYEVFRNNIGDTITSNFIRIEFEEDKDISKPFSFALCEFEPLD